MAKVEKNLPAFGRQQLKRVGRLFELARDITGEHFGLGQQEAQQLPVEMRTLAQLEREEIRPGEVLADICRYQYLDRQFGRRRDLFRVNLQDHNILKILKREGNRRAFTPLLLYVLTHELVHVVRFVKLLAPFHQDPCHRPREERLVHELTQKLLGRLPLRGLRRVLEHYSPLARL